MAAEPSGKALHPLHSILAPSAVAVIGASADPTKRGFQAVRALREAGFAGAILPVNPRGGEILGLPVATSIETLPQTPDLALVCTPAATTPAVLEACAAKGIRGAVVLALGFAESGEAGAVLERSVADVAARTGLRVVGPNTSGILNLRAGLNLVGIRDLNPGSIGVLVQSGNVLLGLANDLASKFQEGISIAVGMGNQTDISAREYLEYLASDADTCAIAMYVESVRAGREFLEVAREVTRRVPVVLLKGGRTAAGKSAARSHTGVLAGEYAVFRAAMLQAGVTLAQRTDELAPLAVTLAWQPPVTAGGGIVVLSDGGGHATLSADTMTDMRLPLALLADSTQDRLRTLLGPAAAVTNPVDLAGASDRDPHVFAEALRVVLEDERVGGVLVAGLFGGYAIRFAAEIAARESAAAETMAASARALHKPIVIHSMYATSGSEPIRRLLQNHVPVIESLEVAARCIGALVERGRTLAKPLGPFRYSVPMPFSEAIASARAEGRSVLLETEARQLVEEHGVVVAPAALCQTPEAAAEYALRIDVPVALKAVSPSVPHKTEAGGVALNVAPDAVAQTFARVRASVRAYTNTHAVPDDFRGMLVLPMLDRPVAEVLVGIRQDPSFGPTLAVGVGGTLTELVRDVAFRILPVTLSDIEEMLDETRLAQLLMGWRGGPVGDRAALIRLILSFCVVAMAFPDITELEANPVFVEPNGAVAVDVRGYLTPA
jgi:acetyltransferase